MVSSLEIYSDAGDGNMDVRSGYSQIESSYITTLYILVYEEHPLLSLCFWRRWITLLSSLLSFQHHHNSSFLLFPRSDLATRHSMYFKCCTCSLSSPRERPAGSYLDVLRRWSSCYSSWSSFVLTYLVIHDTKMALLDNPGFHRLPYDHWLGSAYCLRGVVVQGFRRCAQWRHVLSTHSCFKRSGWVLKLTTQLENITGSNRKRFLIYGRFGWHALNDAGHVLWNLREQFSIHLVY